MFAFSNVLNGMANSSDREVLIYLTSGSLLCDLVIHFMLIQNLVTILGDLCVTENMSHKWYDIHGDGCLQTALSYK